MSSCPRSRVFLPSSSTSYTVRNRIVLVLLDDHTRAKMTSRIGRGDHAGRQVANAAGPLSRGLATACVSCDHTATSHGLPALYQCHVPFRFPTVQLTPQTVRTPKLDPVRINPSEV